VGECFFWYPGSPGQKAVKRLCVCMCVCVGKQSGESVESVLKKKRKAVVMIAELLATVQRSLIEVWQSRG